MLDVGQRRIYFSTQTDDLQLSTFLYQPAGARFRTRPSDMSAHVSWQANLNSRLPAGSNYILELAHNGNGNIEWAVEVDQGLCQPPSMIEYISPPDTPLEFKKPLGTGTNLWPTSPATYGWSTACLNQDALAAWFMVPANRAAFAHLSHTFSHEALNNATYSDVNKEITFNQAWLSQTGLSAGIFSPKGLVPPAITGINNGDAIKGWMDNGITYVVGDNSRPPLRNTVRSLISSLPNAC